VESSNVTTFSTVVGTDAGPAVLVSPDPESDTIDCFARWGMTADTGDGTWSDWSTPRKQIDY
jgi:hypothetical protein